MERRDGWILVTITVVIVLLAGGLAFAEHQQRRVAERALHDDYLSGYAAGETAGPSVQPHSRAWLRLCEQAVHAAYPNRLSAHGGFRDGPKASSFKVGCEAKRAGAPQRPGDAAREILYGDD